ncbi:MAG: helix-turn-helix domain-containing protein [Coriobacteriales bacterium]|jgi:CRP-like cAMP-binding protein|nr:helix-turn-helix domain-containing protein [Coriobacteriales bacterium]
MTTGSSFQWIDQPLLERVYAIDLSNRLRSLIESIKNYSSQTTPKDRLNFFLLALAEAEGEPSGNGWVRLPLAFTHEVISEAIDTSRVTVSRLLSSYKKVGYVRKEGRSLQIHEGFLQQIVEMRQ